MDRITKLEKKSGFCRGREDKEGGERKEKRREDEKKKGREIVNQINQKI